MRTESGQFWLIEEKKENNRYEKCCNGIVLRCQDHTVKAVKSHVTMLATGGMGGLFQHSTNFRHITGDSLGIALEHGITLQDINYIQIHPTSGQFSYRPARIVSS